jgi:hypothetical protein
VANLPGIDDGHGQLGTGQCGSEGDFIPPGGLEDDERGRQRPQAREQDGQAGVIVADAKGLVGGGGCARRDGPWRRRCQRTWRVP